MRPSTMPMRALPVALIALLAVGASALPLGHALPGAALVAIAVALGSFVFPTAGIAAVVLLFPVHPLAMRIAQVDFRVDGGALLLLSAWKEIAIVSVLASCAVRIAPSAIRSSHFDFHRRVSAPDLMALAFVGLVGVAFALGIAGVVPMSRLAGLNQGRLLLFPVLIYLAVRWNGPLPSRLLAWFVVVVVGVAAFGIIQGSAFGWDWVARYFGTPALPIPYTFTAVGLAGPRATGTLASPNEFAFVVGAGLLCSIWLISTVPRKGAIGVACAVFVLIVALGLSFSRSAIVGAGAGAILIALLLSRARAYRRDALALLLGATLLAGAVTTIAYVSRGGFGLIISTVATVAGDTDQQAPPGDGSGTTAPSETPIQDPSTTGHASSLVEAARIAVSHPLGVGLGNVGVRATPGTDERPSLVVESWYLALGVISGVVGGRVGNRVHCDAGSRWMERAAAFIGRGHRYRARFPRRRCWHSAAHDARATGGVHPLVGRRNRGPRRSTDSRGPTSRDARSSAGWGHRAESARSALIARTEGSGPGGRGVLLAESGDR